MGLFRRNKKNNVDETPQQPNPAVAQWQANTQVPFAGERQRSVAEVRPAEPLPDERQQRKIIAALLNGGNVLINRNGRNGETKHDVDISESDRAELYDMIASGEIGIQQERDFLKRIRGPVDKYTPDEVMEGVCSLPNGDQQTIPGIGQDKHMRRIIAFFTGADPKKPYDVEAKHLWNFWMKYATPIDFEEDSQEFLENIRQANAEKYPEKRAEYIQSMRQFKHVMFGKQQQYWEQMQFLNKDAEKFGNANRAGGATQENAEALKDDFEYESGVKVVGSAELSKAQVRSGELAETVEDGTSQDETLIIPEEGLFGVFDGVGGEVGGRVASEIAAKEVAKFSNIEVVNSEMLCRMLNAASRAINLHGDAGKSTGTIAKIQKMDGKKILMWASVGDSRVYVVGNDGRTRQLSIDEGFENKITNALGIDQSNRTKQHNQYELADGDRVVLCTDGITGDVGDDIMWPEELGRIVRRANTAEAAAEDLVKRARKRDDRAAIVVQV